MDMILDAFVREIVLAAASVVGALAVGLTVIVLARALKRRGMGAND